MSEKKHYPELRVGDFVTTYRGKLNKIVNKTEDKNITGGFVYGIEIRPGRVWYTDIRNVLSTRTYMKVILNSPDKWNDRDYRSEYMNEWEIEMFQKVTK